MSKTMEMDLRPYATKEILLWDDTDELIGKVTDRHINKDASAADGVNHVEGVDGLYYLKDFLSPEEQVECVKRVDAADDKWLNDLRRRVQHYGWRYDYKARAITPDMHIGALPDWLDDIAQKLYHGVELPDGSKLFDKPPEQVIVNEYEAGQGIAMHIDHRGFGPTVCTISLLEDWEMDFRLKRNDKQPAMLETGSCVFLTDESRYDWQHGIAPRKREKDGTKRGRRISLTFRTVENRDGVND